MRHIALPTLPSLLFAAMLAAVSGTVRADTKPLNVLTSTTDLAAIVRTVGGDAVSVKSLCKGPEDPHFLDARPSFIALAHQADLIVVVGMELEVGYMPLLIRTGNNPSIRVGTPGYLDASQRINKLEVPPGGQVSRALGDVHPLGNPHYLWDPANAVVVAHEVAERLSQLRPGQTKAFQARADAFRAKIKDLLLGTKGHPGMLQRFAPYKGAPVVSYHADVLYLAQRLGLKVIGHLEPKPGVPPTARHLAKLEQEAKALGARVCIYEVFQPKEPVQSFCSATGAQPVLLAHMPGATAWADTLVDTYRQNCERLLSALQKPDAN